MMITLTFIVKPHIAHRLAYKLGRIDPTASYVEMENWMRNTINEAMEALPKEPQTVKSIRIKRRK